MNVTVTTLRAELATWVDRARQGESVVITERGLPVARLVGLDAESELERLVREGLISPAKKPKPDSTTWSRVRASASVSDYFSQNRR